MLYETNKDIFYNAKWLEILIKSFIFYWIDIIDWYRIMKLRKEIILMNKWTDYRTLKD